MKEYKIRRLKPIKPYVETYLIKKGLKYDPFDDKSMYFEFFKDIRPEYYNGFELPEPNDIGYKNFLQTVDWDIVVEGIEGFYKTIYSDIYSRQQRNEPVTEEELLLKDRIERMTGNEGTNTIPSSSKNLFWLIGLGVLVYLIATKKIKL